MKTSGLVLVNPEIVLYAFILFFTCLLIHVFIWRMRIPKNDAYGLFMIFLIIPALLFFLALISGPLDFFLHLPGIEMSYVLLLHAALSFIYISSYPAAQAISPSLDILLIVASSEEKKVTAEYILGRYRDKMLVLERMEELKNYSLISGKGDHFELKTTGRVVVLFFILYRKLLGLPAGEG